MYSGVAFLLPILLTSQVFCQTRVKNDINDIIYESSGEDYGEEINPEEGNDITYESSADDDYKIISDKVNICNLVLA